MVYRHRDLCDSTWSGPVGRAAVARVEPLDFPSAVYDHAQGPRDKAPFVALPHRTGLADELSGRITDKAHWKRAQRHARTVLKTVLYDSLS